MKKKPEQKVFEDLLLLALLESTDHSDFLKKRILSIDEETARSSGLPSALVMEAKEVLLSPGAKKKISHLKSFIEQAFPVL